MGLVEIQDSDSSGILYSLVPNPDPRFAGKGSKRPSTYHKETCGFKAVHDQPLAIQRSNGFAVGGGPVASGILFVVWLQKIVLDRSGGAC